MKRLISLVLCVLLVLALYEPAFASSVTIRWTGNAGDGLWQTPGNWDPERVPQGGDYIEIPAGAVVVCDFGEEGSPPVRLFCAGEMEVSSGTLNFAIGTSQLTGGKLHGAGDIVIYPLLDDPFVWTDGSIEGSGRLILQQSTLVVNKPSAFLDRYLVLYGASASLSFANSLTLTRGAEVDGGTNSIVIQAGKTLELAGDEYRLGDCSNYGALRISNPCSSVEFSDGFVNHGSGTLEFYIRGISDFTPLQVGVEASLNGTIKLNFLDGYVPSDGDSFEIITYGSKTGTFSSIVSTADGVTFEPTYTGTSLTLTVRGPITTPSAPQNLDAEPSDGQVTLTWEAPASNGGAEITGYQVSKDNGVTWVAADNDTSHTFTSLTNGVEYTFRVRAVNDAGEGLAATAKATPATTPSEPQEFTATSGDEQVTLTWEAPASNGGAEITGYEVSSDNGDTWVTVDTMTSHTFTDLTNGVEYTFKVRAVNSVGAGAEATAKATPVAAATVPSEPQEFTATSGDKQVTLTWEAPASNGGAEITGYQVSKDSGVTWVPADNDTSHTFTDLTNGVEYTFRVRAVNSAGPGAEATAKATPVAAATVPSEPQEFTATSGDEQVTLTWEAPSSNGGAEITGYEVSSDNGDTWVTVDTMTSHTFTDLTNGVEYTFKVRAVNDAGEGLAATAKATPATTPSAPQEFTATPGDKQVTLTWEAPSSNGGAEITGCQVSKDSGVTWVPADNDTSHTFTDLTNGVEYTFRVRAVNSAGPGAEATAKATPVAAATVPSEPQEFTATSGDEQVTLTWEAPSSNGGAEITGYEVSSDNGDTWVTVDTMTSHTFTDLTNGVEYTFKVRAVNDAGEGLAATAKATPATTPSAPQEFTATPGDKQVTLTWEAPASNGGAEITGYEVSKDNGVTWVAADNDSSHTFTDLTNGVEYTFKVRAVNSVGAGAEATAKATPVAAATVPSEPQEFTATSGDKQVTLTWEAPASNGGAEITGYQVSKDSGVTWVPADNDTSHTFTDLTNGVEYTFRVRAVNSAGPGAEATAKATPVAAATVPSEPQEFTATSGDEQVTLTWEAPSSNGGAEITGYEVSSDNGDTWVTVDTMTSHTFTDLTNGVEYTFKVRAVNDAGEGLAATAKATPATTPSAPQEFTATPGDKQVTLTWEAPSSNGGAEITGCQVSKDNGVTWVPADNDTSHTFTDLTNGVEYTFKVRAVNIIGAGPAASVTATPQAVPVVTHTVNFYSDGVLHASKTVTSGDPLGANWPADPTRLGYSFAGWFTGQDGTGTQYTSASIITADVDLYAKWTQIIVSPGDDEVSIPPTPTYQADVVTESGSVTKLPVTVDRNAGTATVDAGSQDLDEEGAAITIPPIPDVDTYSVDIPVSKLSTPDLQETLTVNTDVGSITIPSNMLTGTESVDGTKAQISIGEGDKSTLPEDVRAAVGDKPLIRLTLAIDGKQTDWNNPNAPVTVSIPYTPTAEELANPEGIVAWYIDGSGNVVTIPNGRYDPETGMVTFTTTHFSNFAVAYNPVSFNDVPSDAWYHKAVSFIASRGVTSGTGDGNYSPEAKLTRGDFMVLLMRAYGIAPDTSPTDNFADAGDTYYTGYLAAAKRLGISQGVGDNMYAPGKDITRQEMFTLLYNALKVIARLPQGDSGKTLMDFSDASEIAPWAEEAMGHLVESGIVAGSEGRLNPAGTTTRAEMAQVLYNLLGK
jgi:uncharacterized repeat protein (TIGR02543 family)